MRSFLITSLLFTNFVATSSNCNLIGLTSAEVETSEQRYGAGNITSVERFQKVIDMWNQTSEDLKKEVVNHFKTTDSLNPIYMMAFSGARHFGRTTTLRQGTHRRWRKH